MAVIKLPLTVILTRGLFLFCLISFASKAAVLAEDRADVMYHSYHGGGMSIDGPAMMIRKKANDNLAFTAYYYVDTISSASVDVMSTASPYSEDRKEGRLGVEYLHDKTTLAMGLRQSDESDFLAQSVSGKVSHSTFGDLTNVSLGFAYGENEITRNGDEQFFAESSAFNINASLHQILTPSLTASFNLEASSDEGYLNNPYRTVRYKDDSQDAGVGYQAEVYPTTRNTFAGQIGTSYFLPYRAALFAHYRYFNDSWQIEAHNIEVKYRHPLDYGIELEAKMRYYQQSQAEFYADLFPHQNAQNFLARDKELSDFNDLTLGFSATYQLPEHWSPEGWQSVVGLQVDHIRFDYDNFRDPTADAAVGEEPYYAFSANVVRAFLSLYF